jgi:hypothetical protein
MRHPIREITAALRAEGDHTEAEALAAFIRLARRYILTRGITTPELPDDLRAIDKIGDRFFERDAATRAFYKALDDVEDLQLRLRIEECATWRLIAEYQTYYWFGIAQMLVLTEPIELTRPKGRGRR